jgi:hypothetical protein
VGEVFFVGLLLFSLEFLLAEFRALRQFDQALPSLEVLAVEESLEPGRRSVVLARDGRNRPPSARIRGRGLRFMRAPSFAV